MKKLIGHWTRTTKNLVIQRWSMNKIKNISKNKYLILTKLTSICILIILYAALQRAGFVEKNNKKTMQI